MARLTDEIARAFAGLVGPLAAAQSIGELATGRLVSRLLEATRKPSRGRPSRPRDLDLEAAIAAARRLLHEQIMPTQQGIADALAEREPSRDLPIDTLKSRWQRHHPSITMEEVLDRARE